MLDFLSPASGATTSYALTAWVFLRLLAVVYLIAFASFAVQVIGLVGAKGILPAGNFLESSRNVFGARAYWLFPTAAWFNSSDAFLKFLCWSGIFASLFLLFDIATIPALILLWLLYLSLYVVGQDFMSFQWDILLLETGFLAILLPFSPTLGTWLFRWLLFRLIFLSAAVKLLSGDLAWRKLTALSYHYYTQPLPNIFSWYMHQLPLWFQKVSAVVTFIAEGLVPFLYFGARIVRYAAAGATVGFQLLILATGNYNFFNLLAIALSVFLLDDSLLTRVLPSWLISYATTGIPYGAVGQVVGQFLVPAVAVLLIILSASQFLGAFTRRLPSALQYLTRGLAPLHLTSNYGLFAVMTTSRPEIVIEGSDDGSTWQEYEFKYKPGKLSRAPRWNVPHQPRLDWQMWFAALGTYEENPWIVNFALRLLQGSREVVGLLAKNPFPNAPPRYIRASYYDYQFTNFEEKKAAGAWWKRRELGLYLPPITLEGK